jgi:exodeoxyribonuclease V beta subunit
MNTTFDLGTTPLEAGVTLIEASAGTGKTYSLAGLILRLIAEKHLEIGQILAVTFTIAATAELKERIRERLRDALQQLRGGEPTDEVVRRIVVAGHVDPSVRSINRALKSFDEAQVFTIHAFCKRVLDDYAFESGVSFDAELIADPNPLFQEVARDFWRLRVGAASPLICAILMARKKSPQEWARLLDRICNHPDLAFIPAARSDTFDQLAKEIEALMVEIRAEWEANRPQLKADDLLGNIDQTCDNFDPPDPECLKLLMDVPSQVSQAGSRGRFFDLCAEFTKSVGAFLLRLDHDFLDYAHGEVLQRKARSNTVGYDDLVLRLRDALRGASGERLRKAIGDSYRAALVDEFQDTDPAQYEIFSSIFGRGAHYLYYIGDPKQAIYSFRGADVFTYLAAARDANQTFTLRTNWRSERNLVHAVNKLFGQHTDAFVLKGIAYHEINPAPDPSFAILTDLPPGTIAPLSIRSVASTRENGSAMNKEEATRAVCQAVADDVKRLEASTTRLGSRKIGFGDIAVLVRKNDQAREMQELLTQRGVRAIMQTEQSIFGSDEALELHDFLRGLLEPARERSFKAALITNIIGLTGNDLIRFETDEPQRQRWLDKFINWRTRWANECFMAAFREIIVDQNLTARIVQLPGGERRLTNFLHLAELLHYAETTQRLKPDALIAWFAKQGKSRSIAQEEFQLRLESDSDAVQILTIHKAKGLQYPIVFCPFGWVSADSDRRKELQFHDRNSANALTYSLREKSAGTLEQLRWSSEEKMSEEVRMLYVGITRARNRCNVYIPDYQSVDKSAFALLFKPEERGNLTQTLKRLAESAADSISFSSVRNIAAAAAQSETTPVKLEARSFAGEIDRTAMIASFSGLNTGRIELEEQEPEITDTSEVVAEEQPTTGDTIFDFARGPRAGDFFHAVLERIDFVASEFESFVDEELLWHGLAGTKCRDAVLSALKRLREVELDAGMALRQVSKTSRISELEFTYRLRRLDPAGLTAAFKRCDDLPKPFIGNLERLRFDPVEGYLRGFIDLLFEFGGRYFVVDWKSNWLGNRIADYCPAGLERAMIGHNYFLQAYLYALAADLFLQNRLTTYRYEQHFGGVFYVFLRGLDDKNPMSGVFRQHPTTKAMAVLRELAA